MEESTAGVGKHGFARRVCCVDSVVVEVVGMEVGMEVGMVGMEMEVDGYCWGG